MLVFGLFISFSLIIILVNRKIPIGISVISGGVVLALFAGLGVKEISMIILRGLMESNTIELVLAVVFIGFLSTMMQSYGILDRMVESLEQLFNSTKALVFFIPSLLSTFNATGSAIVAAPILDTLGDRVGLSNARKAAVNIYIRHAWYFVLPIAVHLINASFISEIPIGKFIVIQIPIALMSFLAAYLVYIKPLKEEQLNKKVNHQQRFRYLLSTLLYTSPILISLFLVFWMPFYIALLVGCLFTYFIRKEEKPLIETVVKGINFPVIYAAAGVMVFKEIIKSIPDLSILIDKLLTLGIPLEIIVVLITLLLSYIAANVSVVVSMMYPLVLPLIELEHRVALAMLIYTAAYSAYLISPIHMCQALTVEYFRVPLKELYPEYKITLPVMFFTGVITYIVLVNL
ncbi:MAG: DUF401 family protein [Bacillota bacterium]